MNKLLTTITLLCFSVAANADIYFCTEKATGLAWFDGRDNGFNKNGPAFKGDSWIIDTEQGMRNSATEEYIGSCELDTYAAVICRHLPENGYERVFMINPYTEEEFVFTAHNRNILSVFAYAGTCTKA